MKLEFTYGEPVHDFIDFLGFDFIFDSVGEQFVTSLDLDFRHARLVHCRHFHDRDPFLKVVRNRLFIIPSFY